MSLLNNLYEKNNKVYSKFRIEKNNPVLEFSGNINLKSSSFKELDIIDLPKDKCIGLSGNLDDKVNHSCNPNCKILVINTRAFLYSIKVIKPNDEITFDYSTIIASDFTFNCSCKSYNCRKIIGNVLSLNDNDFKKMKNLGIIPSFILEKYERN